MTNPMTAQTLTIRPVGEFQTNARVKAGRLVTAPIAIGLAVWASLAVLLAQAGISNSKSAEFPSPFLRQSRFP
jgi:hypothetical protein